MRIPIALIALYLLIPNRVEASPVVFMDFFNSDLTFGTASPDQRGYDAFNLKIDNVRPDYHFWNFLQAGGSHIVQQTVFYDMNGEVSGSEYLYSGGTLHIDMFMRDDASGFRAEGAFAAPIVSLRISAAEEYGDVFVVYDLGPGLFERSIGEALNIGLNTVGGRVVSQMTLTQGDGNRPGIGGNHLTPVRQAWDGYTIAELTVPEPEIILLAIPAAGAAMWRRRARRIRLFRR